MSRTKRQCTFKNVQLNHGNNNNNSSGSGTRIVSANVCTHICERCSNNFKKKLFEILYYIIGLISTFFQSVLLNACVVCLR